MNDFDEDLEAIFIEETFHKSEPIREKAIQLIVERVWIKDKKPKPEVKDFNGVIVKSEFKTIRETINERFLKLQNQRQEAGVVFETDDWSEEEDNEDNEQFEDVNDDTLNEELGLSSSKSMNRSNKRKLLINLAKKLKKKSIANRLGMTYMPGKTTMKDMRSRLGTSKSWSEKFGKLLAAKKLLYLPLLYRKYRSGPRKTRQELDIEIDLYMAEVKTKTKKLCFDEISDAVNSEDKDKESGFTVIDLKERFGGFGGPGWRKRLPAVDKESKPDREALDMEIDDYMQNKTTNDSNNNDSTIIESVDRDELDMDLDKYMAAVKKKAIKNEIMTNGSL